ncbi:ATP-binding cassette domain-containing protein [Candidatus Peregrinibacteria bacterium]|nr:ATP-binding cassette domain-containing protein [Candidatus Peregrinibacteria bacterium]
MNTIRVRNLRKKYSNTEALKGVSFEVDKGEIVGFLGPNGAGKTTTMKILSCFMAASSGEATVAGHDCFTHPLLVQQKLGYLPENNPLYPDMKVYEYLRYMAELHNVPSRHIKDRIKKVAEDCGFAEKIDHVIHNLSKGYRQRIGLGATLVHDPEILILDEPTVGLDPNQIVEIRGLIKKLGREKTVILCSHVLTEVEMTCNRIVIIDQGIIAASGTAAELRHTFDAHVKLKVVIRGEQAKALGILTAIPGVKNTDTYSVREKGAYGFVITVARNRDPRPEISRIVIENGLQLLEIHRELASLESIFNQVTTAS